MSVSTTTNRISYTGNGATLAFAVPYQYYDQTHLKVYVNAVLQTLTTHYTVSPTTNTPHGTVGGTVTFLIAPANGLNVLIIRQVPNTQTATLQDLSLFPATTVEQMSDLLTFANQQQDETAGRAITIPITSTLSSVSIPDPALTANQGKYLQTVSTGLQLVTGLTGTTPNPVGAKGDLIVGDASGIATALAVGSDGAIPVADSAQAKGVKWSGALYTAKGDLAVASASTVPAKVSVGTDGQVLKADSASTPGVAWSNPAALDGIRGLRVIPHEPTAQGTWTNGTTTYAASASGFFAMFSAGVNGDGHIFGDVAQFGAVNYLFANGSHSGSTVVYEYWNGASWTALSGVNLSATPTWTVGYNQLRFTVPGDWALGGSGTSVPQNTYNIRVRATTNVYGGLLARASATNKVDLTADEVIASNGIAKAVTQSLGTISPNILLAGSAANGRDQAGVFSANTYVYLWLIYNPTSTTWAGLWSTSATAPTMPTSYTFKVRVGGYRIDANSVLLPWVQNGNRVKYATPTLDLSAGAATTATAVTLTVPSPAIEWFGIVQVDGTNKAQAGVHPVPFGTYSTTTCVGMTNVTGSTMGTTTLDMPVTVPIEISQTTYYSAGSGSNAVYAILWGYKMPGNIS